MIIDQKMFKHLGVTGSIENPVKTVVELRDLVEMPFACMVLGEIHRLLHFIELFFRDVVGRPTGTKSLES